MKLWKEIQEKRYSILRIVIFNVILVCIFFLIHWDKGRLNNDFRKTMLLLRCARMKAFQNDQLIIVRFSGPKITVANKTQVINHLTVPTLLCVNYNTTLGPNMIAFNGHGTSDFNVRIHGGVLNFKSWFGWEKNIHVNCTGLAREGLYPTEDQ